MRYVDSTRGANADNCDRGPIVLPFTPPRPSAHQPGSLAQQLAIVATYLGDPDRHDDRDAAWQRARAAVLPWARGDR